jgi:transmembrane sensor
MSKVAEEDSANGRDEQAADWCLRMAEGVLSVDEQRAFDAWIADADNRAAVELAAADWRSIDSVADKPELIRIRSQALESFRRANSMRWMRRMPARWELPAGLAASLALAIAVAIWFLHVPTQAFETGTGERRIVMLEDGTQLSLDAASHVEVRMARDRRELHLLRGRARFDVARNPLRPFTVAAANKVVVALGTSFSVELLQRQMHVVLYEGRVQVLEREGTSTAALLPPPQSAGEPGGALLPGRELVASLDTPKAQVVPADLQRSSSWETGQLNFVNEPLGPAIERMNRYSKEKLSVRDPRVAAFKVNGVFTAGDVKAFVEGVTAFSPVRAVRESRVIVLEMTGSEENSPERAVPQDP